MDLLLFIVVLTHLPILQPIRLVQHLNLNLRQSIAPSIVILTDPATVLILHSQPVLAHFKQILLVIQININPVNFETGEHQATVTLRGMSLRLKILQRIDFRSI